ncbi:hypothetical protein I204_07362 [Kwoniella mangroviensis CBS 8886]|nr:hypothetical protein I204_07362 [Kwoniella mangroviensis CBS 8886]
MTEKNAGKTSLPSLSDQTTTSLDGSKNSYTYPLNKSTIIVDITTAYHLDPDLRIIGSGRRRTYKSPSKCVRGVYDLFVDVSRSEIHPSQIEFLELQIDGRSMEELPDLPGDVGMRVRMCFGIYTVPAEASKSMKFVERID